jgi:hypothetical protein
VSIDCELSIMSEYSKVKLGKLVLKGEKTRLVNLMIGCLICFWKIQNRFQIFFILSTTPVLYS